MLLVVGKWVRELRALVRRHHSTTIKPCAASMKGKLTGRAVDVGSREVRFGVGRKDGDVGGAAMMKNCQYNVEADPQPSQLTAAPMTGPPGRGPGKDVRRICSRRNSPKKMRTRDAEQAEAVVIEFLGLGES